VNDIVLLLTPPDDEKMTIKRLYVVLTLAALLTLAIGISDRLIDTIITVWAEGR